MHNNFKFENILYLYKYYLKMMIKIQKYVNNYSIFVNKVSICSIFYNTLVNLSQNLGYFVIFICFSHN
jgi:hypothetical protein